LLTCIEAQKIRVIARPTCIEAQKIGVTARPTCIEAQKIGVSARPTCIEAQKIGVTARPNCIEAQKIGVSATGSRFTYDLKEKRASRSKAENQILKSSLLSLSLLINQTNQSILNGKKYFSHYFTGT
jgi:uncharacterized membrane-anchored protein